MHDFHFKWLHTSLISHIRFPFYDSLREYSMRERAIFIFSRILNNRTKEFIPFLVLSTTYTKLFLLFFFPISTLRLIKAGKQATTNNAHTF